MSTALRADSTTEDRIRNEIQAAVLREIERRKLSDEDLDELLKKAGDGPPDYHADGSWAYSQLENHRARPANAPSIVR